MKQKKRQLKRKKHPSSEKTPDIGARLHNAQQHFNSGNLPQAKSILKNILASSPSHPDASHLLGLLSAREGDFDASVRFLAQSIALSPQLPVYRFNLARVYHNFKEFDRAVTAYEDYLKLSPGDPDALNLLGRAWQDKGNREQAIACYEKVLKKLPNRVDSLNSMGLAYFESGRIEEAISFYNKALQIQPDDFIVLHNLGDALASLKKTPEAITCFQKSLSVNPRYAKAHNNLGSIYKDLGDLDKAIDCFQKATALDPGFSEAYFNLGIARRDKYGHDDAVGSFQQAIAINPDYAEAHQAIASILYHQGSFKESMQYLKKSLGLKSDYPESYFLLSLLAKSTEIEGYIAKMESLFAREDIPGKHKQTYAFALGTAYGKLGKYDKAFRYLDEGNRLTRENLSYSSKDSASFFRLIKGLFNKALINKGVAYGNTDPTPIFILGMPRSGTSLAEQILASHPDVYGAGELLDLREIFYQQQGTAELDEAFKMLPGDLKKTVSGLGREYIIRLRRKCADQVKFITDKMPHNFLFIGLIRMALPNAKIIHCQRDPMDNCFSIYKISLHEDHKYSFNLKELGEYYLLYHDLMRFWHKLFPGKIHTLNYESLVADQENETRKLLEYCGLTWHDACLSFHKTARTVATASASQVKRPIYKDSVRLWEHYKKHLKPLSAILEKIREPDN